MTFPLAAFTIGAILIYTAFKDATLSGLLRGETEGSENVAFFGSGGNSQLTSISGGLTVPGSGRGGKTTNQIKNMRGLKTWKNGNVVIAAWIYWELKRIGFTGQLTSGYRTPAYSESLCYDMCGAPSCPGRCAGKSSNHSGKIFPAGAIDVASGSLAEMNRKTKAKGSVLKNRIGASDPIHFSASGY